MQKSIKKNILLIILLIIMFIVIPNFLISIQGDFEIPIDEKNPNEIINTRPPQKSSVYYVDTTGGAIGVYVSGDYAYVADGTSGLAVINISDPTNPGSPVYEDTDEYACDVYVSGDYAYVADGGSGLAIIDISDPTNPGTPIYEDTTGFTIDVYVSGNYAYVVNYDSGLAVIDISNPTNPGTPIYEDTTGFACDVYVSGDYAYVADFSSGLAVINISDPTNPDTSVYEDTNGYATGVYVSGDYAYLADGSSGLAVIDISNPTNPGPPVYEDTTGYALDIHVSGDYAYVADNHSKLAIINITNPTNPGTPIYENMTGSASDVYVSGDYAYVVVGGSGLVVVDISMPIDSEKPVYEDTTGYANGVYVSGDYAYVADGGSGLAIIDISDTTNPGTPIYEDTTGFTLDVYVSGNYAYLADNHSGLAIIDISDPTNPGIPINEGTTGAANSIYVSEDFIYVADVLSGLAIINISDPTNPGTPVYEDTDGAAAGVYVSGDYAYVADYDSGLAVIDISDPTNPGTPVYEDTDGRALDVYVSGDYAYVADYDSGLAVIDISDPTNPGTPVYEDTDGRALDVYVSGDYAYVANHDSGLAIIDISDPTNPGTPIYEDTTGSASGVYVSGDYAYIADFLSGLAVIQVRKRVDMEDPLILNAPSDFIVEAGYIGQVISWTATDANPDTYTIELQGTGIVVTSTPWANNTPIVYNITDGFSIGSYIYMVNFTDDYDNFITNSINFTVEDTTSPTIISVSSNLNVEIGYTGQSLFWTATDVNPDTYTIELQGTGIITGPIVWETGLEITNNIPDGFTIGVYVYIINFTDDYGNSIIDDIIFTVGDTTNPTLEVNPSNIVVELGYTGQNISWTATDINSNTYIIELQGSGIVTGPIAWTSGLPITYNIPDGFTVGDFVFTVNFTDDYENSIADSVTFTVEDTIKPIITFNPNNFTVEYGYTGKKLSWTAIDLNPNSYLIEMQGIGIVAGPTVWVSGDAINYNLPDRLSVGSYIYTINFTDFTGNFIIDSITFTVEDTTNPVITIKPNNFTVEYGDIGQSLSWTVTDANPDTYTIELLGIGIVVVSTPWANNTPSVYNLSYNFPPGIYTYNITFTDQSGNSVSDAVTVTIVEVNYVPEGEIPFGNTFLIFIGFSTICLIFAKKRQIIRESK